MKKLKQFRENKENDLRLLTETINSITSSICEDIISFFNEEDLSSRNISLTCLVDSVLSFEIKVSCSSTLSSLKNYTLIKISFNDDLSVNIWTLFPKEIPLTTNANSELSLNTFEYDLGICSYLCGSLSKNKNFIKYINESFTTKRIEINKLLIKKSDLNKKTKVSLVVEISKQFMDIFSKVGAKIPQMYLLIGMDKCLVTQVSVGEGSSEDFYEVSFIFKNKEMSETLNKNSFNLSLLSFAKSHPDLAEDIIDAYLSKKDLMDKVEKL